jgi:proteasome activator subunit 4
MPFEKDTALQWYSILMTAVTSNTGERLLKYADELVSLLQFMADKCKSERGYTYTGRILSNVLAAMTNFMPSNLRSVDNDLWNSEGMRLEPSL